MFDCDCDPVGSAIAVAGPAPPKNGAAESGAPWCTTAAFGMIDWFGEG